MIRNMVVSINSQHSRPTEVAWMVRETSWTPHARRESVVASGSFRTPDGGPLAVLSEALCEVLEAVHPGPLCPCGKPATHVLAHEDSPQWSCRVPE